MKTFLLILVFPLLSTHLYSQSEYSQILNTFNTWKAKQYKAGTYADEKHCNMDTMMQKGYKGPATGIPQEINISYFDINHDDKIDALVTFFVDQCDGGNAYMNVQIKLLVLSKANSYSVDEEYFERINHTIKSGWIIIENAMGGSIMAHIINTRKMMEGAALAFQKNLRSRIRVRN